MLVEEITSQENQVQLVDAQRHAVNAGNTLRQLTDRLTHLATQLDTTTAEPMASELQTGIQAVCHDLLDDAAATLHQLGSMTDDDIVRRRLEVCDLAERLASHDAA